MKPKIAYAHIKIFFNTHLLLKHQCYICAHQDTGYFRNTFLNAIKLDKECFERYCMSKYSIIKKMTWRSYIFLGAYDFPPNFEMIVKSSSFCPPFVWNEHHPTPIFNRQSQNFQTLQERSAKRAEKGSLRQRELSFDNNLQHDIIWAVILQCCLYWGSASPSLGSYIFQNKMFAIWKLLLQYSSLNGTTAGTDILVWWLEEHVVVVVCGFPLNRWDICFNG